MNKDIDRKKSFLLDTVTPIFRNVDILYNGEYGDDDIYVLSQFDERGFTEWDDKYSGTLYTINNGKFKLVLKYDKNKVTYLSEGEWMHYVSALNIFMRKESERIELEKSLSRQKFNNSWW